MKKLLSLLALVLLTGCATDGQNGFKLIGSFPGKVLDKAAEAVTKTTTNVVETAVVTANQVVSQNPVTQILETNSVLSTNWVFKTNFVVEAKPSLQAVTHTGSSVSGWLPPPYGEVIGGAFGLLSAGLTWLVRRRGKMLNATIKGIEMASATVPVKESVEIEAIRDGVISDLHALVKKVTSK